MRVDTDQHHGPSSGTTSGPTGTPDENRCSPLSSHARPREARRLTPRSEANRHIGSRHIESQHTEQPGRYEQTLNVRREDLSGTYPLTAPRAENCKTPRVLEFGVVVLGVSDRDRASAFWRAALSYRERTDGYGGWAVVLEPVDGDDANRIALQLTETAAPSRPRMHLDLHVASAQEQISEADRLVALGAVKVQWDYPEDPDFVVLADTEDNLFCTVDRSHTQ
jgi:hypothetical protein